jgi:hypothetical protein
MQLPTSLRRSMASTTVARGCSAVMAGFFLLAALVQLNDPDPLLWMPGYVALAVDAACHAATGAVAGILSAPIRRALAAALVVLAAVHAGSRIDVQPWTADVGAWLDTEVFREAGGLLVMAAWLCGVGTRGSVGGGYAMPALLLAGSVVGWWAYAWQRPAAASLAPHCRGTF